MQNSKKHNIFQFEFFWCTFQLFWRAIFVRKFFFFWKLRKQKFQKAWVHRSLRYILHDEFVFLKRSELFYTVRIWLIFSLYDEQKVYFLTTRCIKYNFRSNKKSFENFKEYFYFSQLHFIAFLEWKETGTYTKS